MYVETSVADQGLGIRPDDLHQIFRPFVKGQNIPTSGERATGLGLAIVSKIFDEHHGEMWVEGEYGQGSTFCFKLPLDQGGVDWENRAELPPPSPLLPV